jgi:hypothetical protein
MDFGFETSGTLEAKAVKSGRDCSGLGYIDCGSRDSGAGQDHVDPIAASGSGLVYLLDQRGPVGKHRSLIDRALVGHLALVD